MTDHSTWPRLRRRDTPALAPRHWSAAGAADVALPFVRNIPLSGWGPFLIAHVRSAIVNDDERPLRGRVLVLEDPAGRRVALIATDLHGGSRYVSESVAYLTADLGFHAGNVFLTATHNHAGPGGLYASPYYDALSASTALIATVSRRGRLDFNLELAQYVATRLADAVRRAVQSLRRAVVGQATVHHGWARNRSMGAFRGNFPGLTDAEIIERLQDAQLVPGGASVPEAALDLHAVDGRVHTLAAFEDTPARGLIGSLSTYGAHCALIDRSFHLQSADFFGEASRTAQAREAPGAIVALAAGAIGDADPQSPHVTLERLLAQRVDDWRPLVAEYGDRLGLAVSTSILTARSSATRLTHVRSVFSEPDVGETLPDGQRLAARPMVGASTIAGSEFGPGDLWPFDFSEERGRGGSALPEHAPKRTEVSVLNFPLWRPLRFANRLLPRQYRRLGLRLLELGRESASSLRVLALPGEPTTWLSVQLARLAGDGTGGPAMVTAVTGDYQGYLTTAAEYDAQHYEGSSTIWGRATEAFLRHHVGKLVGALPGAGPATGIAEFDADLETYKNNLNPGTNTGVWTRW